MNLDLDRDDLRIINEALCAQPFGLVAPLVAKINEQIMAQMPAPVAAVPSPADDPHLRDGGELASWPKAL